MPDHLWQAEIFFTWLEPPYAGRDNLPIIGVDEVMEGIKEAIYPAFHEAVSDDVREQLRVMAPDALLPVEAIREFLNSLCFRGFLEPHKRGFRFSASRADAAERRYRAELEAEGRQEKLEALMSDILATADGTGLTAQIMVGRARSPRGSQPRSRRWREKAAPKPLGFLGFSWIAARIGLAHLPDKVRWSTVGAIGALAGIGFTISLFISGLAFSDARNQEIASLAIIAASTLAGLIGYAALRFAARGSVEPQG